jgi:hypothetical protein
MKNQKYRTTMMNKTMSFLDDGPLKNTKEKSDLSKNYLIKQNVRKKQYKCIISDKKNHPSLVIKEEREE